MKSMSWRRFAPRVVIATGGLLLATQVSAPWSYLGFVIFVSQFLNLTGVARKPLRTLVPPEPGRAVDVQLSEIGPKPIEVMKAIREFSTLGVREVHELYGRVPTDLGLELAEADAQALVDVLEEAGAAASVAEF